MASSTEEVNFSLNFILINLHLDLNSHIWVVATVLDNISRYFLDDSRLVTEKPNQENTLKECASSLPPFLEFPWILH